MARIELSDNIMDMITKMAEGNPGAMTALIELNVNEKDIDPDSGFSQFGIGNIMSLDTHEIYGSDIYILWSDKCNKDTRKMAMLLRSVQLGFLPESKLQDMASDQMRKINLTDEEFSDLDEKVCEYLPNFKKQ